MYKKVLYHLRQFKLLDSLFLLILLFSFLIRVINLNYNSAFNDEGIYIVIGRMGLFANDWWSYGANLWMAGLPYIYPVFTGLAYQVGGLVGSRLLNVFFGVLLLEEVYRFTRLQNLFDKKTNQLAGIIALFISGLSSIGIYVSKLATLDMLSFLLLFFAINCFLKANLFENGKYYFLAAISLLTAFLTKIIIATFFPAILIFSLFLLKNRSLLHKKFAFIYFFIPFLLGILFYLTLKSNNLLTYILTHKDLGKAENIISIYQLIWKVTGPVVISSVFSVLVLIQQKRIVKVLPLMVLSLVVPVFHLALGRYQTLNKHLYLTIIFLSVITGYGFAITILSKEKILRLITTLAIIFLAIFYIAISQKDLNELQSEWKNTYELQDFLREKVKPGDKVLTENGGAVILSLYDKIFPPKSIVTFDWIDYSKLSDDRGYLQAVKDQYFDYIELDGQAAGKDYLAGQIRGEMNNNYFLIYKVDTFEVYAK